MMEQREGYQRAFALFEPPGGALERQIAFRERRRRRRRVGATIVGLGFAALLAAGAVAVLRISNDPTPAIPDQETVLPESAESWTRAPSPLEGTPTAGTPGDDGNRMRAIVEGGSGLVAVGAEGWTGAIWTSSDGKEWNLVERTWQSSTFLDVTTGGPGLVAVALGDRGWTTQTGDAAPIWTSVDGLNWTRAPSAAVFEGAWLRAVGVGGPGLVAVGSDVDGPAAWVSSDGLSWQKASVPAMPPDVAFDGKHADAWMQDVATNGDRFVAVGSIGRSAVGGGTRYEAAVWTSSDGTTWTQLPAGTAFPPVVEGVRSVAAGPAGFVAVGGTFRDDPWIWTSADGLEWDVVPEQDAFVPLSSGRGDGSDDLYFEIQAVAAGPAGYVAVGGDTWCVYNRWDCLPAEAAVWTSPDGRTWHRVPSAPVFRLGRSGRASGGAVTAWGSRFVVTTAYWHSCQACESGAAVWISEPATPG